MRVSVVSGTYILDGLDILLGGRSATDPASTPIAVTGTPERTAVQVGRTPSLPKTVNAVSADGTTFEAKVNWRLQPDQFTTACEMVTVTGTLDGNPSLAVQAPVEVIPAKLAYLVDANALDSRITNDPDVHATVAAAVEAGGGSLLNDVPDRRYEYGDGWGAITTGTAKAPLNQTIYDKSRDTGYYGDKITYRFTLPAGNYRVTSGHSEWWKPREREVPRHHRYGQPHRRWPDREPGTRHRQLRQRQHRAVQDDQR